MKIILTIAPYYVVASWAFSGIWFSQKGLGSLAQMVDSPTADTVILINFIVATILFAVLWRRQKKMDAVDNKRTS